MFAKINNMVMGLRGQRAAYIRALLLILPLLFLQTSCASRNSDGSGGVDGIGDFSFDIAGGQASLAVVFPLLEVDAGARIPIQGLGESFIEIGPDFESGGTIFSSSIDIEALFRNRGGLLNFGLPDGRPIPGIRSGGLPAQVVQLPLFGNSLLYRGADIFGMFLPIDLGPLPLNVTTRMRDQNGNIVGVLTAVAKNGNDSVSGALFLFPIEGSRSERNLIAALR